MQKVFNEVNSLDKRCYEEFGLTEDILMENASASMLKFIEDKFQHNSKVLIVSGVGNNGADGIALSRMLHNSYDVSLYIPFEIKSQMGKLQLKRAKLVGINIVESICSCDILVDCLFGSGLNRYMDQESVSLIEKLNNLDGYKLACDIPSGINCDGQINQNAFIADTTVTMGALKRSLFTDEVKDSIGDIKVANLGIQREVYELNTNCYLLDTKDINLPYRTKLSTHKGNFGHLAVVVGEKEGAGLISCESAFNFGVGLITAITQNKNISSNIMSSTTLPLNSTALAIGMGLGTLEDKSLIYNNISKVIDADMFYDKEVLDLLDKDNIVLTPHPKEFINLLKLADIADISIDVLQKNRFKYIEIFCSKYPKVVLLLKGANVLIGQKEKIYINQLGGSKLSFGGSGDVLSGLIGSLLAQGYSPIDSAISGSLAHTMASNLYEGADFSLTPKSLINELKHLTKTTIKKI
ncbi:MAG: NAD(P)H-hydrate dehydratase [Campylobacterota bacterium]|nr:NAD(P)H-hydrate dehydratase [Campylobacterota bacterium]